MNTVIISRTDVLLSWWREHGDHFVHVDPAENGEWHVSIYIGSTCVLEGIKRFRLPSAAKAAADDLLRRALRHRCEWQRCRTWVEVAR